MSTGCGFELIEMREVCRVDSNTVSVLLSAAAFERLRRMRAHDADSGLTAANDARGQPDEEERPRNPAVERQSERVLLGGDANR